MSAGSGPSRRVALVTGATDGIGRATALALTEKGFEVVVHGRSEERLEETRAFVLEHAPRGAVVHTARADLASLRSTRQMAQELLGRFDALHALVLNAGVFATERRESEDGYELSVAVNHLAHFLLARELLPALAAGAAQGHGRVVTVSSMAHSRGQIAWDDPMLSRSYSGYAAYAQSKLMNVMFANELAHRAAGKGVTSNSLHPGVITTKLLREGFRTSGAPVSEGAKTSVLLATSPQLARVTGAYFADGRPTRMNPLAEDASACARLWMESEKWLAAAL
jgi:NAD(P)-dependent dehydrogenase (short-subunit alcohol dehydrogenase family)